MEQKMNRRRTGNSLPFILSKSSGERMNIKGDFPTLLLFGLALVFSILALFVMISSGGGVSEKSGDFADLVGKLNDAENSIPRRVEIILDEAEECDEGKFVESFYKLESDLIEKSFESNLFEKIERGEFELEMDGNGCNFSISNLEIEVSGEGGKIKRNFDLEIKFDNEMKVNEIDKVYK
jgi:hypothetical protein